MKLEESTRREIDTAAGTLGEPVLKVPVPTVGRMTATEYMAQQKRKRAGDPRFHALLAEIASLHDKKQEDYGSEHDPFANVRASERWGVSPWVGALIRLNDKVHRLQQFAQKGKLANESAEDSMMDVAVYALIALVLYREEGEKRG